MGQIETQVGPSAVNGGGNQAVLGLAALYVADLELNVTDTQLFDVFGQIGPVISVRVCRDVQTRQSLGYGYVNFSNPQDAARAKEVLNYTAINGKTIRVMISERDPSMRKSRSGNIFVKNLDHSIDHKGLHDTFSKFGDIISCKIATDSSGQSKGYGFVQYDNEECAHKAIEQLNGMLINDKQVYVGPFLSKQERELAADTSKFTNVYVKNLSEAVKEEDLRNKFGEYGKITSVVVMREGDGKSKCFGFVNFENADDAAKSVEALNGQLIDGKEWYVGKAQKKSEREHELKARYEQSVKASTDKAQGLNIYVNNLDQSIDDDKLKEVFAPFGTVTSCKILQDPSGLSKGSGFVSFSAAEEASRALSEMNGKIVGTKLLYVALARRKEDRKAKLQEQYSNVHPIAMTSVGPRMPVYPPVNLGLPPIFYGQGPRAFLPQPGFGYRPPLVRGMRPGGPPVPNFHVPLAQQGHQGSHPGGRRAREVAEQQTQQPVPLMLPQAFSMGHVFRHPPSRGMPVVSMPGITGGMLSAPQDISGMPSHNPTGSLPIPQIPIKALASLLAHSSPTDQKMILGKHLYPLVEKFETGSAAKVTGMLLDMDQPEVLHLIESPEALQAKVAEAMKVLRSDSLQQQTSTPADQLAALSLNDALVS